MSTYSRRPTNVSISTSTTGSLLRRPGSSLSMNRPSTLVNTSSMPASSSSSSSSSASSSTGFDRLNGSTASTIGSPVTLNGHDTTRPVKSAGGQAENNINVVVRVRGRSSAEISANETLVAEVEGLRSPTVTLINPNHQPTSSSIAGSSSTSTTAYANLPSTKTYDFGYRPSINGGKADPVGNVFGPDADQVMLYNDVAKPILEQVMQGYNCTIFAYGQTGTGKTYTMEGDISLTDSFQISPQAGIIPRTLYSLFAKLSEDQSEFSVKCSFLEIYNEDLRDLNALDYVDPESTSTSKNNHNAVPIGLKIYEDKKSGVVVVQGLEETMIRNAEEGIKVLKRGSDRRQVAATKCNDRSSRSHSIFTITIHVKENSARTGGEDLLKVGKLNLVDLAGSENIGRSGAKDNRAREAGKINESLLALGRVINKLVEKVPKNGEKSHIPYRDSTLTRLLQDSLGGRTKTTIIAAISPVNFDETISTLDYASKAKSIQNRPEVNQRMSKNLLLGQYAGEIERLKADLVATRQHNGIYFSNESWDLLSAEQDAARVGFADSKRALELCEARIEAVKDQYEMSLRLVGTREKELKLAGMNLESVREQVRSLLGELEERTAELEATILVKEATEHSRRGWKDTAQKAVEHTSQLHDKIDRKSKIERKNLSTVIEVEKALIGRTKRIAKPLPSFIDSQDHIISRGKRRLADTIERGRKATDSTIAFVDQQNAIIEERGQRALDILTQLDETGGRYLGAIDGSHEDLVVAMEKATKDCEVASREADELRKQVATLQTELATIQNLSAPIQELHADLAPILEADAARIATLHELDLAWIDSFSTYVAESRQREATRIREDRTQLTEELGQIASELGEQLSAVLSDAYVERFMAPLQSHFQSLVERQLVGQKRRTSDAEKAIAVVESCARTKAQRQVELIEALKTNNEVVTQQHQERSQQAEKVANKLERELVKLAKSVSTSLVAHTSGRQQQAESQVTLLQTINEQLLSTSAEYRSEASACQTNLDEEIRAIVEDTSDSLLKVVQAHEVTRDMYSEELLVAREDLKTLSSSTNELVSSVSEDVVQMQQDIESLLSRAYLHDPPTGATPARRQWPMETLPQLDGTPSRVVERLRVAQSEVPTMRFGTIDRSAKQDDEELEEEEVAECEKSEDPTEDVAVKFSDDQDDYRAPTPPSVEHNSLIIDAVPVSPVNMKPRKRNNLVNGKGSHAPLQVVEDTTNLRTSRSRRR